VLKFKYKQELESKQFVFGDSYDKRSIHAVFCLNQERVKLISLQTIIFYLI